MLIYFFFFYSLFAFQLLCWELLHWVSCWFDAFVFAIPFPVLFSWFCYAAWVTFLASFLHSCYDLNVKCSPKALREKSCLSLWYCQEVVTSLEGGAWWKEVRSPGEWISRGTGIPAHSSLSFSSFLASISPHPYHDGSPLLLTREEPINHGLNFWNHEPKCTLF